MSDLNPVAIILVTSGTRGHRLLFRYPFEDTSSSHETIENQTKPRVNNRYAHRISEDRLRNPNKASAKLTRNGVLVGFEDNTLANLLAVKKTLCGSKFTVKIDDVRFVGFPIQIEHSDYLSTAKHHSQTSGSTKAHSHRISTINVVFALSANIVDSAIDSYHALSKELVVALRHEEQRCHYLSLQSKTIRAVFDQVQTQSQPDSSPTAPPQNPFRLILQRSQLANELRQVHTSLVDSGVVSLYINRWVAVNFCLPHKVHVIVTGSRVLHLEPREVEEGLVAMRPYHGLLLLTSVEELLADLPVDSSPSLIRLVKVVQPMKNLLTLSLESDLSLSQVFQLACHLVYWGKAIVIFPLCESNEYMLSPIANTLVNSTMVEEFVEEFPGKSLHVALADFSLPTQLWNMNNIVEHPQFQQQRVLMVIWLLQRRLLIQIHKYVYFVPGHKPSTPISGSANSSMVESSFSNVQVEEESLFRYVMDDHHSNLEQATSMSDVASVNSDESIGPSHPIMNPAFSSSSSLLGKQLSKSPSLEVQSDGSVVAEDTKSVWHLRNTFPLKDLNSAEQSAVLQCPAARNPEDLQLFARLLPYFNGLHHLEEIMFYENMRRSQLLTVIEKFKDVLIVVTHE
ncbi:GATOR1 complex protein NPRL3-like [Babylonia areolata]|uniref:GATOR1 complex protein NPRL3-like n=1 Tax=Babylonia areolata TaxID=304850 RepID=UPI003FD29C7C